MDHQHQSSSRKLRGGGSATSSSSEEINNEGTTKRSYDCTFCKRGFINGRSLGGHMKRHRRDPGKAAMQAPTNPSSRNKNPDSYNHVGQTNQSPANYHHHDDHLNRMHSWGAYLSLRTDSSNIDSGFGASTWKKSIRGHQSKPKPNIGPGRQGPE